MNKESCDQNNDCYGNTCSNFFVSHIGLFSFELTRYALDPNDALNAQRRAQNAIIAAETRRSQILSAIEGV